MLRPIYLLSSSFIFTLMTSCNVQSVNPGNSVWIPKVVTVENSIVYLFFEIEKMPSGSEKITHTDTKITKGIMKNTSVKNSENVQGNLLITMLGKGGEIVEERIIEDPLNPVLEVYAEDGLSKSKVNLPKAEFSIRFNQKGTISSVKVEKISASSKINLITLKL